MLPGLLMLVGVALIALQVYLFVLAASRVGSLGLAGGLMLLLAAVVSVGQIFGLVRLRGSSCEWASYPVTFGGLVVSACLLFPLMVSIF